MRSRVSTVFSLASTVCRWQSCQMWHRSSSRASRSAASGAPTRSLPVRPFWCQTTRATSRERRWSSLEGRTRVSEHCDLCDCDRSHSSLARCGTSLCLSDTLRSYLVLFIQCILILFYLLHCWSASRCSKYFSIGLSPKFQSTHLLLLILYTPVLHIFLYLFFQRL